RRGQELLHVLERRAGLALEHGRDRLDGDLRCHFALRVPAHAIGEHEQGRLARVAVAHAVLVLLAAAAAADLEDGELHRGRVPMSVAPPTRCTLFLVSETRESSCMRMRSATDSRV